MTRPRKILLMDDSELALRVEQHCLVAAGYEVRTAKNMLQFVSVLSGWSPDLILTDVEMPEMRGDKLCTWLKRRTETKAAPVILFSSLPEAALARIAGDVGADGYVSKKDGLEHLVERLEVLCQEILG